MSSILVKIIDRTQPLQLYSYVIINDRQIRNGKKEFLIRCDSCGNEQWYRDNKCAYGARKFCSRKCVNKGRKHSAAWKDKMSKKFSGSANPFFGKTHSPSNLEKCILAGSNMLSNKKDELGDRFEQWFAEYKNKFVNHRVVKYEDLNKMCIDIYGVNLNQLRKTRGV